MSDIPVYVRFVRVMNPQGAYSVLERMHMQVDIIPRAGDYVSLGATRTGLFQVQKVIWYYSKNIADRGGAEDIGEATNVEVQVA